MSAGVTHLCLTGSSAGAPWFTSTQPFSPAGELGLPYNMAAESPDADSQRAKAEVPGPLRATLKTDGVIFAAVLLVRASHKATQIQQEGK